MELSGSRPVGILLFSPKGSGIFWAKALRRKTNLSGGRASNNAQTLAPWREGGYQVLLGTTASSPRVSTEGRSASLAHLWAAGRPGRHSWNGIAYLLALPELKWGYSHQLLWKEHASESSEKSKDGLVVSWLPRRTVTPRPRERFPASQMRGKESQQTPK